MSEAITAMRGFVRTHNLRHRAETACREWLRSAADEGDLGAWKLEDFEVAFERCALIFDHSSLGYPFVETRLGLHVNRRRVGHYRLITLLDGTDDDDYFVLDEV